MRADGIYRKVFTSMWGDSKFRQLSAAQPNAQTLWLFLLTGDHTNIIPGLSCAGEARLAETLGWSVDAFRTCWKEIEDCGMAMADWRARVVWLPNAIRYNDPPNQNVVKSWAKPWAAIPECALKEKARRELQRWMRERGETFLAVFEAVCPSQGSAKRFPKRLFDDPAVGSPNQEQQQDQEEEQEQHQAGRFAPGAGREAPGFSSSLSSSSPHSPVGQLPGAGDVEASLPTRRGSLAPISTFLVGGSGR